MTNSNITFGSETFIRAQFFIEGLSLKGVLCVWVMLAAGYVIN